MNCLLNAFAMSFGFMCVLSLNVMELMSCCVGCVLNHVLYSSKYMCFVCDPIVFQCVPSRYLSCLCL